MAEAKCDIDKDIYGRELYIERYACELVMKEGGVVALARDYYDAGLEAAEIAVRILRGEDPKDIPFSNTRSEKLVVNSDLVRRFGLHLSAETMHKAVLYPASD